MNTSRIGALMGEPLAQGPRPTGRPAYVGGVDALAFERLLGLPVAGVWPLLTQPGPAARWAGTWRTVAGRGTVEFRGTADGDGAEPVPYRVTELVPGRAVEVAGAAAGAERWRIRCELLPAPPEGTRLRLVATVPDPVFAPLVGAAADFYLDRLTAVAAGLEPGPRAYDDYVAGQARHYRTLLPAQRQSAGRAG